MLSTYKLCLSETLLVDLSPAQYIQKQVDRLFGSAGRQFTACNVLLANRDVISILTGLGHDPKRACNTTTTTRTEHG